MIAMVKVVEVRALDGFKLHLRFSDGEEGVRDCADIVAETGPMVEPLRDPAFFRRVFIEYGALAWPNGYDIDPIALYREMQQAGSLTSSKVA
jgi:uncharacterized protein DUF2442